jgi:hypothetical protein
VDLVIIVIGLAALVPLISYGIKRMRGEHWPTTTGTLAAAGIHHGGLRNPFLWLCQFEYRFTVNGAAYSGKLVIGANDEAQAQKFQAEIPGQSVTVRYNPPSRAKRL